MTSERKNKTRAERKLGWEKTERNKIERSKKPRKKRQVKIKKVR
jgi:hypothetical protein